MIKLPSYDEIKKIGKDLDKYGPKKVIKNIVIAYLPILVFLILYTNYSIKKSEQRITSNIETSIRNTISQEFHLEGTSENKVPDEGGTFGESAVGGEGELNFEPNKWILGDYFTQDDEGYWCPSRRGYPSWSMWTSERMAFNYGSFETQLYLKNRDDDEPNTLIFTVGSYEEFEHPERASPKVYYSLSLFDGDNRTIRLYDSKGRGVVDDRLHTEPNFEDPITLIVSQRIVGPDNNKVILTPTLKYNPKDEDDKPPVTFISEKEFSVRVPLVDLENLSVQAQLAIGVYAGDCFKPMFIKVGGILY